MYGAVVNKITSERTHTFIVRLLALPFGIYSEIAADASTPLVGKKGMATQNRDPPL